MRISDWSSDVCSSDLLDGWPHSPLAPKILEAVDGGAVVAQTRHHELAGVGVLGLVALELRHIQLLDHGAVVHHREGVAHVGDDGEVVEIGRASCRGRVWQYV